MGNEVIIDGVNVSECEFYFEDNGIIAPDGTPERTDLCTSPEKSCKNNDCCACNPNCYFKQLKRLEEEKKQSQNQLQNLWANATAERIKLEAENEKLKAMAGVYSVRLMEKYKQALEDIKTKFLNQVTFVGEAFKFKEEILNKINEVLNESH